MTDELKAIFDLFVDLIEKWNAEKISNEEELLTETKNLNARLTTALAKPQPEQTKIEDEKPE